MAAAGLKEMPFRFFDLPRELRNTIYGELACDLCSPTKMHPYVTLAHYPSSNLRLINKQFKEEYEDDVLLFSEVVLHADSRLVATPIRLSNGRMFVPGLGGSALLSKIRKVHVAWCLDESYALKNTDMQSFLHEMRHMIQHIEGLFPRLRTLHIMTLGSFALYFSTLENKVIEPDDVFAVETLSRSGVSTKLTLLLWARLFVMHPRLVGDPRLASEMDLSSQNTILYHVTRSDDSRAMHGLNLTTYAAGTYDYDALVYEAQDQGQDGDEGDESEDDDGVEDDDRVEDDEEGDNEASMA